MPLGVVAFALAWRLVGAGREEAVPPPLDWTGMLLTGVGLGGLTYAAHLVSLPAPPAAETALCFAGSAALLTAAFWHLRRAPHPLVNLRTLSNPTFRVTPARRHRPTCWWSGRCRSCCRCCSRPSSAGRRSSRAR